MIDVDKDCLVAVEDLQLAYEIGLGDSEKHYRIASLTSNTLTSSLNKHNPGQAILDAMFILDTFMNGSLDSRLERIELLERELLDLQEEQE